MEEIKISIIIPVFKSLYFKECIDSILNQTYSNWELIVLNDASPENIDSIMNCYSDTRIFYYKNDSNVGAINVVDNWNKCLALATGDYLICMGDDDKLLPNCLLDYIKYIQLFPDCKLFHGWAEIIDEKSNLVDIQSARPLCEGCFSMIWHRWDHRKQFIGDFLFNTEALRGIGGFFKMDLAWGSDDITAVKVAKLNGVVNTEKIVFQYRACSQSISRSSTCEIKMRALIAERDWYKEFLNSKAKTEIEEKYRILSIKRLPIKYTKRLVNTISEDMLGGSILTKVCKWIIKRREYELTISMVLFACVLAIKDRRMRKKIHP